MKNQRAKGDAPPLRCKQGCRRVAGGKSSQQDTRFHKKHHFMMETCRKQVKFSSQEDENLLSSSLCNPGERYSFKWEIVLLFTYLFSLRVLLCRVLRSPGFPGSEGARWSSTLDKHPISWPSQRRLLKMRRGRRGGGMRGCFGHRRDAAQRSPPAPSVLQVVLTFPSRGGKQPLPQRSSTRARQSGRGKAGKSDPAAVPRRPLCPALPPEGDGDGGRGFCTGVCMRRPKCLMSHGVWGEVAVTWPWWHRCGKPSMCQATGTFPKM